MPEEKQPFEIIDVSEAKPEDLGTLSLRYVDGAHARRQRREAIPASLAVVNDSGAPVAAYTAGPAVKTRSMVIGGYGGDVYIADTNNHHVR
ncbi:hypothetical protein OHS81_37305 [Streptomyces sp. NBC_00400]|uniref:hypothetical protein n=1 Tax=Streptomyces sp. NBC_00400 TaxID=2975737 RepID=UPI002E1FB456